MSLTFADQAELGQPEPGAALGGRDRGAEQPELGRFGPALGGEALLGVDLAGARCDLGLGELVDGAAQQALLVGEAEVGRARQSHLSSR